MLEQALRRRGSRPAGRSTRRWPRTSAQRAALWKLRENIPEAQRREGASLKHDIAVPVGGTAEFVAAGAWLDATQSPTDAGRPTATSATATCISTSVPGRRAAAARPSAARRPARDPRPGRRIGGSFSAEHGIGRLKVGELERYAVTRRSWR